MKKNTTIDGIAASEHLDSSGESLSIEGMDISFSQEESGSVSPRVPEWTANPVHRSRQP